ncbi:hypothetical protein K438DRAFT_1786178 [Mycena galopus ATCC 62051]|nr:hypothetical protein K438DRAFT_1786178 [Mycena galopus ATCC 62051]
MAEGARGDDAGEERRPRTREHEMVLPEGIGVAAGRVAAAVVDVSGRDERWRSTYARAHSRGRRVSARRERGGELRGHLRGGNARVEGNRCSSAWVAAVQARTATRGLNTRSVGIGEHSGRVDTGHVMGMRSADGGLEDVRALRRRQRARPRGAVADVYSLGYEGSLGGSGDGAAQAEAWAASTQTQQCGPASSAGAWWPLKRGARSMARSCGVSPQEEALRAEQRMRRQRRDGQGTRLLELARPKPARTTAARSPSERVDEKVACSGSG